MSRVNATANYAGAGVTTVHVDVPSFNPTYLRQMFKHRSSGALMPLFAKACDPAKEWTESASAWAKLRKWLKEPTLALHIGDGAHSRTAAFFAFHSPHENVNIDPVAPGSARSSWRCSACTLMRGAPKMSPQAGCWLTARRRTSPPLRSC